MPTIEHSLMHPRVIGNAGLHSYSKIMAIYNSPKGSLPNANTPASRMNRVSMSFKETTAYESALAGFDQDTFSRVAGADLSTLFMPYLTYINTTSGMPGFYSGVGFTPSYVRHFCSGVSPDFLDYLPIDWEPQASGYAYDMWVSPSGDSMVSISSSSGYLGQTARYRDKFDMRGIALRGPLMISSWGFDKATNLPFPSGHQNSTDTNVYPSGTNFFAGGKLFGYDVSPDDYVTAPLEMYYDQKKNVWCTKGVPDGTGLFQVLMLLDDKNPGTYNWSIPRFTS